MKIHLIHVTYLPETRKNKVDDKNLTRIVSLVHVSKPVLTSHVMPPYTYT